MENTYARSILFLLPLVWGMNAFAQGGERKDGKKGSPIESRDQADGWYLPVRGEVTVHGEKGVEGVTVQVFKENADLGTFPTSKTGRFDLELDLDAVYTLHITKPGFQPKTIVVDANLPKEQVAYPAYQCYVKLEPEGMTSASDPFYLDFPSAIVRYNAEVGGFYHSEAYLEHINNKLHSIAKAEF